MSHEAVWKALADPTRRALLDRLRDRPRTTGDLCLGAAMSRYGVMKHLDVLEEAGLVVVRRKGRERWNHLNPVPLRQAYDRWMRPYAEASADTVLRLKAAAESSGGSMSTTDSPVLDDAMRTVLTGALDIAAETRVAAPPEKVWEALLDIGAWWPHRFHDESTVVLEAHLGGHFFEDWGNGGGMIYGTVYGIDPGKQLSLRANMGMTGPVAGTVTYLVEAAGDETVLSMTHKAFGDIGPEAEHSYTSGWTEVTNALLAHLGT